MLQSLATLFTAICLVFVQSATAADTPHDAPATDSILVFDASGSMWGQIDGVNKIVTAREVVSQLVDKLPSNQQLGLLAYGHNRKGDCQDIELLVPVGTDRAAIRQAVEDINPRGMTPMTDAVIQAAEILKYTEHEATVILVSDGEETCHADPCGAAERLAELGVNLTVHTVGFGLPEAEAGHAEEQLQCLAKHTGGQFFLAKDADELRLALGTISETQPATEADKPAEPKPQTIEVTLQATDQKGGPVIDDGLIWTVKDGGTGETLYESEQPEGAASVALTKGIKDIEVVRVADQAQAKGDINPANAHALKLPIIVQYQAHVAGPDTAAAASTIRIHWEGPDQRSDYIAAILPGGDGSSEITYTYTGDGSPLELRLPPEPGDYEIVYVQHNGRKVLARHALTTTPVTASLTVPEQADAADTIRISWQGPDYRDDYIAAVPPGGGAHDDITYTYTRDGSPLELRLPPESGDYEIIYVQHHGKKVLARQAITTLPITASLTLPEQTVETDTVRVSWQGPDYRDDYIAAVPPGGGAHDDITYAYTREGSPLELKLPPEPGDYEIIYVQHHGKKVLARSAITREIVK